MKREDDSAEIDATIVQASIQTKGIIASAGSRLKEILLQEAARLQEWPVVEVGTRTGKDQAY